MDGRYKQNKEDSNTALTANTVHTPPRSRCRPVTWRAGSCSVGRNWNRRPLCRVGDPAIQTHPILHIKQPSNEVHDQQTNHYLRIPFFCDKTLRYTVIESRHFEQMYCRPIQTSIWSTDLQDMDNTFLRNFGIWLPLDAASGPV